MAQSIYYNFKEDTKLGKISIGLPVFNVITEKTLEDMKDISLHGKNAIATEYENDELVITINMKIIYGGYASKLSKEVQEKVANAILEMTNIHVNAINVNVIGIEF